ncbi:MAG: glycosyl hydrolase family 18 protein [bacterium]
MNLKLFFLFLILLVLISSAFSDSVVVGYYPYWNYSVLPAESIKYNSLTHIMHAFIWPRADGSLSVDNNVLNTDLIERAHNNNVKVLISVGGAGHNTNFDEVTADSASCGQFVQNLLDFCNTYGYDGIDIDWEPVNSSQVGKQLNLLMSALKDSITSHSPHFLLTMAVPATDWFGQWCDFDKLKNYVDWFNVMTYDFFWSTATYANHNSPLYSPVQSQYNYGSVNSGINYIHSIRGVPEKQIVIGIPFYGHACYASGLFGLNTGYIRWYSYSEIEPLIGNGWNFYWDDVCKVPYLLNEDQTKFITFDDTTSVRLKCEYATDRNVAGVLIWEISKDVIGSSQPLLETIGESMGLLPTNIVALSPTQNPETFIILDNYPNPFNNSTVISYFVPRAGKIKLEIFSILGKRIESLIDETKCRGWYKVVFKAQSYTSGEYVYRLTTTQQHVSKKMIIIK